MDDLGKQNGTSSFFSILVKILKKKKTSGLNAEIPSAA